MSTIVEEIRARLARYPQARVEHDASSITCFPTSADGFLVRLTAKPGVTGEQYTVYYNGSHEDFRHRETAIKAFALGLSTGCRLREYSRFGKAYRWVIELWDKDKHQWKADWDVVRCLLIPWQFWQRPMVRCLQNRLIDLDSGESVCA